MGNKTPQNQRQVQQNKPNVNRGKAIDLKDPKIAEASRKAKIAMAAAKNAQIIRKLHSVDLKAGHRPAEQVKIEQIKAKSISKPKSQKAASNGKINPTLTQEQIKNLQKQQVKKMQQQNPQQNVNKQKVQAPKKQLKPNIAEVKH